MKRLHTALAPIGLFVLLLLFSGCDKSVLEPIEGHASITANEHGGEVAREWFKLICKVVKSTDGYYPPMAARAFGHMGVVLYQTVQPGMAQSASLAGQLNQLSADKLPKTDPTRSYNWGIAANAAMAQTMRNFFVNIKAKDQKSLDSLETYMMKVLSTNEKPETASLSVQFGKEMANAIFEWSKADGGHEGYLRPHDGLVSRSGEFAWQETGSGRGVGPKWGNNRLMVATNSTAQIPAPHAFSTDPNSALYKEALEVYTQSQINTEDQKEIARFWADDPFLTCTPTGHTFSILTQLLEEDRASLARSALAYAKMGIAENDAFIRCWWVKYEYFLLRPKTYIRRYIDPNWDTLIETPPFPAYVSGHSSEIGAASKVFTSLFGASRPFSDRTQVYFGFSKTIRYYNTFEQVALESAFSRLYGGLHYRMDIERGLDLGRQIGDNVNRLNFGNPVL
ncbi:MAG: vanadium-dependent haloperoxidase [Rhodothermia bacterium]|nr:vanadium-dependent haloperoxidase [Rhodothermia bacterium]